MLVFMGPALILPISDPLMSLIDAICLGRVRIHHEFVLVQVPAQHTKCCIA
jgi:hypothetical protein